MRVIQYTAELDENRKNILVKESSKNCPGVDRLNSPDKVKDMLNFLYNAQFKAEEYMWLIALDTKCNLVGLFELSHGTVNASLLTPREIFVRLCLCGATYFIIAHNHPSGDVTPSKEDINVTTRINKAGDMMGIKLLDHIIIGDYYYSFKENKLLN